MPRPPPPRVGRVEVGLPTPLENNTLQGVAALPAYFHARG